MAKITKKPTKNTDESNDLAFLAIGIVFTLLGAGLLIGKNVAGIAFATMGITFLIISLVNKRRRANRSS